jgi:NADH-quinone oxidoreductase subunit N
VDLYGGTRHSSAIALKKYRTPEEIKRATMHSTNKAFERYFWIETGDLREIYKGTVGSADLRDYRGVGLRLPLAGAAMVVFLVSLTGLPPTAGFIGKFFLFKVVVEKKLYVLALIGGLNSVVSLVYYMKVVKTMYFEQPAAAPAEGMIFSPLYKALLVVLAAPLLYLGIFFQFLYDLSRQAVFG